MKIVKAIKSIFSSSKINAVRGLVGSVYPIVELVAKMTPTKADDEILMCANALGVRDFLMVDRKEVGKALKEVAVKAAQKKFKDVPADVLARAVEAAYQQMKAKDSL